MTNHDRRPASSLRRLHRSNSWKCPRGATKTACEAAEYKRRCALGCSSLKGLSDSFETQQYEALRRRFFKPMGSPGRQVDRLAARIATSTPAELRLLGARPRRAAPMLQHLAERSLQRLPPPSSADAIEAVERDQSESEAQARPASYGRRRHCAREDESSDRPQRRQRVQGQQRQSARYARPRLRVLSGQAGDQAAGKLGDEFITPRCVIRLLVDDAGTLRGARLRPQQQSIHARECPRAVRALRRSITAGRGPPSAILQPRSRPRRPGAYAQPGARAPRHARRQPRHTGPPTRSCGPTTIRLSEPTTSSRIRPSRALEGSGRLPFCKTCAGPYGSPPARNANYDWIQHCIHYLAHAGTGMAAWSQHPRHGQRRSPTTGYRSGG